MTQDEFIEELIKIKKEFGNDRPHDTMGAQVTLICRDYIESEKLEIILRVLINYHGRDYVQKALDNA